MSTDKLSLKSKAEVVDRVMECGIVGAGGAGFPTHVKLNAECNTVIVNGAECEPLLESDKYRMQHEADRLAAALELVTAMSGARRGVIALKKKYRKVVMAVRAAVAPYDKLEVYEMENFYPAGDEHVLVRDITGVSVPPLGIPLNVGCIVQNVETMLNIHAAVFENRPVTRRWLTCGGAVKSPAVVEARVGVSFREVIDKCGGALLDDFVILVGGPMMGSIEHDIDAPVTKLTSGIIVLPSDHKLVHIRQQSVSLVVKQSKTACCQCSYCTELCPRYLLGHNLEPHKIMRNINLGLDIPEEVIRGALLCSECGVCETVACTMDLSPRLMNRFIKQRLRESGYKADFFKESAEARDMYEYRKIATDRVLHRLELSEYNVHPDRLVPDWRPARSEVLLRQHIGAPVKPLVRSGDRVKEGELLADFPAGALGARLHAPIEGEVVFVDAERIIIEAR